MNDESDFVMGLMLLLTSRVDECEAHFIQNMNNPQSPAHVRVRSTFGHSLVAVVRALITFEDDDKTEALARLQLTQKAVQNSLVSGSSWFSFGSSVASSNAVANKLETALYNLDMELIGADAGLFLAMIQFTQESAMGIMRGALTLRKSYKVYQRAYKEVRDLVVASESGGSHQGRQRRESSVSVPSAVLSPSQQPSSRWTSTRLLLDDDELFYDASPTEEDALGGDSKTGYGPLITRDCSVMDRVIASSKMGTGLFHLVFSLIPPRFFSMIGTAMGFETTADRAKGLRYLRSCVDQGTSRSPLAALVLLAFHSAMLILARGVSDDADSEEAFRVLDECLRQYPDSPLFRFFEGRLYRGRGTLQKACESFEIAQKCSRSIHQMSYLCIYERAWCTGLLGSSREAGTLFLTVAKNSSWAPAFYGYLGACFYYEQAFKILCLMPEEMKSLSVELSARIAKRHPDEEARLLLSKALSWFRTIPNLGKKQRSSFPPEKLAVMRCAEVNLIVNRYLPSTKSSGNTEASDDKNVSVTGLSDEKLKELVTALFWPTIELVYFWNGFFQIEYKSRFRKDLEQSMSAYRKYQSLDSDLVKRSNFQNMYRLFRGTLLREERQFADADAELALLVPRVDFQDTSSVTETGKERWTIEFGKYERGLCQWELGDRKQAVAWWNAVKDSGHPLDSRLKFRLKSALRKASSQGT